MRPLRFLLPAALFAATVVTALPAAAQEPPTTEFEDSGGSVWTSHDSELAFLEAVDAASDRVEIEVIGESIQGRPLHLVKIGHPVPHSLTAAQSMPVELHICTQHGNEPAGREACLIALRDLAFTDDPTLLDQLGSQVTLFVPTANPDGRATNSRENAAGSDLNRQHLQVDQPEVQALGRVIRDWKPALNMDHHEYGPSIPALYDDDLLILWPRNLNVHEPLHDLAMSFAIEAITPCVESEAYSTDEYGLLAVDTPVSDVDVHQTAGDWDDGISRNAAGLRHGLGILVESAVSVNPRNPAEVTDAAATQDPTGGAPATMNRRVHSQVAVIECTLAWMRDNGQAAFAMSRESMAAKALEGAERSAPTYFDGQYTDTTLTGMVTGDQDAQTFQDPPFCGFLLAPDAFDPDVEEALAIHAIEATLLPDGGAFVPMAQVAEPVVGLLLDARGERHLVGAEGLDDCSAYTSGAPAPAPDEGDAGAGAEPDDAPLPATGGGLALAGLLAAGFAMALRGRASAEGGHTS